MGLRFLDRDTTADVVGPAHSRGRDAVFDHLGEPGLQNRLLRLESRRIHVGQVIAQHLHSVTLGMSPGCREINAIRHELGLVKLRIGDSLSGVTIRRLPRQEQKGPTHRGLADF